jgi:hypothetical protein
MSTQQELIDEYLKQNASKPKIGVRAISDHIKERKLSGNQLPVLDVIKAMNYQLDKQSVINPFHQTSNK